MVNAGDELVLVLGQGRTGQIPARAPRAGRARLRRRAEHDVAGLRRPAERRRSSRRPGPRGDSCREAAVALATLLACALAAAPAAATPVATNEQERELLGRVFPEPIRSVDFINHGPTNGPEELRLGFEFLEQLYPGYLEFTTVAEELGDPNAVSLGPDGKPAWDPADAEDGYPFYVAKVTDESVPDSQKDYVLLLNAHPAEPCGQEGMPALPRGPADLARDGARPRARRRERPARQAAQDQRRRAAAAGEDLLRLAVAGRLGGRRRPGARRQRQRRGLQLEPHRLPGRLGVPGDRGAVRPRLLVADPARGRRRSRATCARCASASSAAGRSRSPTTSTARCRRAARSSSRPSRAPTRRRSTASTTTAGASSRTWRRSSRSTSPARASTPRSSWRARPATCATCCSRSTPSRSGPVDEKAAYLTLEWAEYATAWEHLDYTVGSSWGGWAGSRSGLGADSIGFETACRPFAAGFDPALFQLFVDNVRAANETGVVQAAQRQGRAQPRAGRHARPRRPGRLRRDRQAGHRPRRQPVAAAARPSGHAAAAQVVAGALRRVEHRLLPRPAADRHERRSSRSRRPGWTGARRAVDARGRRHDRRRRRRAAALRRRRRQPRADRRRARPAAAADGHPGGRGPDAHRRTSATATSTARTRGRRACTSARARCSTRSGSAIRC